MAAVSESDHSRSGQNPLMTAHEARDGTVTVRVGDDVPDTTTDVAHQLDDKATAEGERQAASVPTKRFPQTTATSKRASQIQTAKEAPAVVPLPFSIPAPAEPTAEDQRSSIATFAADDVDRFSPTLPQRPSLARELSGGSLSLLRSVSPESGLQSACRDSGECLYMLMVPKSHMQHDDNGSLAATIGGESISGSDRRSVPSMTASKSIDIGAKLSDEEKQHAGAGPGGVDAQEPRAPSPCGPPPKSNTSRLR